jgi:hypothetical protein
MTIEDLLRKSGVTIEELEAEMRARDELVNELRSENRYIRAMLEPMIVKKQREEMIASKGPGIVLGVGVQLGK